MQGYAVPTFVKNAVNCWAYVGNFRVQRQSFDKAEIHQYALRAGREEEVTSVLFLESA